MHKPSYKTNFLETKTKQDLLGLKINSLELDLASSWLAPLIEKLKRELRQKHLLFTPHIWLSDDWFSPDGSAGFAIPFYLLHPRLIELEKEMMGFTEGESCQDAMKLMRHETGHAIDNAFRLRRNKRRQVVFGLTSKPYPKSYLPDPKSKNFVRHLEDHYAQAHPDEDWAETFSVWLTPMSRWQKTYAHWPALEKLECLDYILKRIQMTSAPNTKKIEVDELESLDLTLGEYYRKKTARMRRATAPLKRIFSASSKTGTPAWKLIHQSQSDLTRLVAKNSTLQHNRIKRILIEVKRTCRQENLHYSGDPKASITPLISLIIKEASGPRRINM